MASGSGRMQARLWAWVKPRARLVAGSTILAVLLVVVWVSSLTPHLRVCEQVCRPLGLLDPPVLITAVLALLLLGVKSIKIGPEGVEMARDKVRPEEDLSREGDKVDVKDSLLQAAIEQGQKGQSR